MFSNDDCMVPRETNAVPIGGTQYHAGVGADQHTHAVFMHQDSGQHSALTALLYPLRLRL